MVLCQTGNKNIGVQMINGMKFLQITLKVWRTMHQAYTLVTKLFRCNNSPNNTVALRDGTGTITANTFDGVATSANYADLAEIYSTDKEYEVGTVMAIGGDAETTEYDKTKSAFGVIRKTRIFNEQRCRRSSDCICWSVTRQSKRCSTKATKFLLTMVELQLLPKKVS